MNQPNLANQPAKNIEAFAMHLATKKGWKFVEIVEQSAKKSAVAFFTVRMPRARTHQQQLECIAHHVFNRRVREPAYQLLSKTAGKSRLYEGLFLYTRPLPPRVPISAILRQGVSNIGG